MGNLPRFTTPIGKLGFPAAIAEPDTKFADEKDPDDHGDFKARLVMSKDDPEAQKFLENLQATWDEFYQGALKETGKKKLKVDPDMLPWADEMDRESDEPTGNIIFRCKLPARVKKRAGGHFDQKPAVFDASKVLLKHIPNIGPGSTVRLSGEVRCWRNPSKMGMTLRFKGCQLIELVEGGSNMSADACGFDEVDGGYTDSGDFAEAVESATNGEGGDF